MTKLRTVRTSFNAGELMPQLDSRFDIDAFQNGAAEVLNLKILPQGGTTRRPGTRFCAALPSATVQGEDFVFDTTQAYIFIFREAFLDIYDGAGVAIATVAGPWTAAMIGRLSCAQQGDTMIVAHPDMVTQRILRTGATTFTVGAYTWEVGVTGSDNAPAQPYYKYLPPDATMTVLFVSYPGGSTTFDWTQGYRQGSTVTLVCSHAFFNASHVGQFIKWQKGYIQITAVTDAVNATGTVQSTQLYIQMQSNPIRLWQGSSWIVFSDPFHGQVLGTNVFITGAAGVGTTPSTQINGQRAVVDFDAMSWSVNTGTVATEVIYGGGDGIRYWGNAMRSREWQEPAVSPNRGYFRSVTFDDQRLIFGGCKGLPNRLFASRTDAPFNFDTGSGRDNESIQASISSQRVAIIESVVSYKHLQIFTSEGEYFCPGSDNKPLTPASISFKRQSAYGSNGLPPVEFDGSTLYITKTGAVREFLFSGDDASYNSPSLSFMAQHLISGSAGTVVRLESQIEGTDEQECVAYAVRNDGAMAVMSFSRKEKVLGWALCRTAGVIRDVVSVNRRLFAMVNRAIGMCLEEVSGLQVLDCASSQSDAVAKTSWPGFALYNGTTVQMLGPDNEDMGSCPVAGGIVTTPKPVTQVTVGYPFDTRLRTLAPEMNLQDGPLHGQPRRVVRVLLDVHQSMFAAVNGHAIQLRRIENVNAPAPAVANGKMEFWLLGWDTEGQVTVSCAEQGPLTIKSLLKELEF